ncbi:MAG: HAD-IC family P-type ATPase [Clostridia bacterium]|nr:HAD-IC family P-type ATPase [Clostridia bacterium]
MGKKNKKNQNLDFLKRFSPDINIGLTKKQVAKRIEQNLTNKVTNKNSKSYLGIICSNTFTFFNLIWAVIIAAYIYVGSFNNLLFSIIIIANTLIAIIQECKAKRTVDKLSLVTAPKIEVLRDGEIFKVPAESLVLDDIIILETGNQIPADCIVVDGVVEVNESLLTGESNAIKKSVEAELLAGSFIVSGNCKARVNKIADESYIQSIAMEAKKFKSPNSNLFKDLNRIIKYIGIAIVPMAVILFISNSATSPDLTTTIVKTCGALTGMVPAGMFLLVTIALALGVIKLSTKKTLVQDLYSIEMLARTDVLCLDKTGTITDGTMEVTGVEYLTEEADLENYIESHLLIQNTNNSTGDALVKYFGSELTKTAERVVYFSSERKFSATTFHGFGTLVVGAPEFVCTNISEEVRDKIENLIVDSKRVLMVAKLENANEEEIDTWKNQTVPLAIISIEDQIRPDAIETIRWFKENGVKIKIISGDNPITVSTIAKRVGIEGYDQCVSLDSVPLQEVAQLAEDFTIFGRVSPEQKHHIVKSLKEKGYVVGMTGDGVNDTLALKEADCSIAMADGSDVARSISNLVLMDSKFSSLPSVVKEGRQVINNIQKSSTLFLMKTFFTFLFSLFVIFIHETYPFESVSLILLELFVIGIPSFILALEPNERKIEGQFISTVLRKSLPSAFLIFFNVATVMILHKFGVLSFEETESLAILTLTMTGFFNLVRLCFPLNKLRAFTFTTSLVLITLCVAILPEFFQLTAMTNTVWSIFAGFVAWTVLIQFLIPTFEKFITIVFSKKKPSKPDNQ